MLFTGAVAVAFLLMVELSLRQFLVSIQVKILSQAGGLHVFRFTPRQFEENFNRFLIIEFVPSHVDMIISLSIFLFSGHAPTFGK